MRSCRLTNRLRSPPQPTAARRPTARRLSLTAAVHSPSLSAHAPPARRLSSSAPSDRRLSVSAIKGTDAGAYLFDTNGYLVLRGVFTPAEVDAANAAIDAHAAAITERTGKLKLHNAYGVRSQALAGSVGRFDLGGMLEWPSPECDVFRSVLTHPQLVPYYHMLLGKGYRLDHLPFTLRMLEGSEGHAFHGGPVDGRGAPAWPLQYSCAHGQIRCSLLAVALQLSDARAGDGGFCIIPGSHKANFACPPAMLAYEAHQEHVVQPELLKGDVLLFTEAATHGTLPWRSKAERRTVIYRFSPSTSAYGRSDLEGMAELEGISAAEAAVLQPPFHARLDRVTLDEQGEAERAQREQYKKEFDKKVFGKNYF